MADNAALTPAEREIADLLAQAANKFNDLWLGGHKADNERFVNAIHEAQLVIGMRVARRADWDFWRQ